MANSFLFGTVGSPLSTPKKPGGTIGAINQIHQLGLQALELGWVRAVRISEDACAQIKSTAQEMDISLSIHAPYFINLNADDEEWPKSRKRLMDAAYFGNLAGATDIIFHPGSYFDQPAFDVLKIAIPRLADCVSELRKSENSVILRPETMGKSSMLGSLEDTLIMGREIPGVLPCLDFAHLHARPGDGSMNSESEWQKLLDNYQKYLGGDSLKNLHIHISGIEYTQKGEKNHLPIQESDFNIHALFKVLDSYDCSGRILCVSPVLEDDAIFMQELWASF